VNQPKLLSDRVWANIRSDAETYLRSVRRKRHWELWQDAIQKRVQILSELLRQHHAQLPLDTILPGIGDLYERESFRAVLDTPLIEDDESDPVTETSFQMAMTELPLITEQWRASATDVLRSLLPAVDQLSLSPEPTRTPNEETSGSTDRLLLATSVFSCKCAMGRHIFSYPNILAHRCRHQNLFTNLEDDVPPNLDLFRGNTSVESLRAMFLKAADERPFNDEQRLQFARMPDVPEPFEYDRAVALVRLAGLDPETTTQAEMDASSVRFSCTCARCMDSARYGRPRVIMDWRNDVGALPHTLDDGSQCFEQLINHKGRSQPGDIRLVPAALSKKAIDKEALMLRTCLKSDSEDPDKFTSRFWGSWMCVHCRESSLRSSKELWRHLSQKRVLFVIGSKTVDANNHPSRHGITEARRGADHDFVLDAGQFADPWKTGLVMAPK
jgi:hypothetical protein